MTYMKVNYINVTQSRNWDVCTVLTCTCVCVCVYSLTHRQLTPGYTYQRALSCDRCVTPFDGDGSLKI